MSTVEDPRVSLVKQESLIKKSGQLLAECLLKNGIIFTAGEKEASCVASIMHLYLTGGVNMSRPPLNCIYLQDPVLTTSASQLSASTLPHSVLVLFNLKADSSILELIELAQEKGVRIILVTPLVIDGINLHDNDIRCEMITQDKQVFIEFATSWIGQVVIIIEKYIFGD